MRMQHNVFIDSMSFLSCSVRKLPEAFGLTVSKSWYPHYFNTKENLDYVGSVPGISCYGQKTKVFDNRRVFETYCQDDVTVLRQACQVFRREFIQIGNIEVLLEAITIASACNKVLHKRFLKPDTIGLIPTGG